MVLSFHPLHIDNSDHVHVSTKYYLGTHGKPCARFGHGRPDDSATPLTDDRVNGEGGGGGRAIEKFTSVTSVRVHFARFTLSRKFGDMYSNNRQAMIVGSTRVAVLQSTHFEAQQQQEHIVV